MSINATLFAQMIVFALLVWFTMKFVWPVLLRAMDERKETIADGLAAAEKGRQDLEDAKVKAEEFIREAREKAMQIIDQANHRADEILEEARESAVAEGERLVASARAEIEHESNQARDTLRREVAAIAMAGATQILEREIDPESHRVLLDELVAELLARIKTAWQAYLTRRRLPAPMRKQPSR